MGINGVDGGGVREGAYMYVCHCVCLFTYCNRNKTFLSLAGTKIIGQ